MTITTTVCDECREQITGYAWIIRVFDSALGKDTKVLSTNHSECLTTLTQKILADMVNDVDMVIVERREIHTRRDER